MISAKVYLWGTLIGVVSQKDFNSIPTFEYNKDFTKIGIELSPIMMPLSNRIYSFPSLMNSSFNGLPGLLADSLPDKFGNSIINQYLKDQGRNSDSLLPIEKLLFTGKRGMGALEYEPEHNIVLKKNESIILDELAALASEILSQRETMHLKENERLMEQIISIGTSAGGARAKAIIAWNKNTGDIRSGQISAGDGYEYWLVKFDGIENNKDKEDRDTPIHTRLEYAYYLMATDAGIKMSPCELYEENGKYHFMTKRFDRLDNGEKVHMQTLGALTHYDYNIPMACGYEQAVGVMQELHLGQDEIEQFFLRMVFNVFTNNKDDHVKNISFLMDKNGIWSLSPAYDITYAYNPNGAWTSHHQMTINGKSDDFTIDDFYKAGAAMNISKKKVLEMINDVKNSIRKWSTFTEKAFIPEFATEQIRDTFVLSI